MGVSRDLKVTLDRNIVVACNTVTGSILGRPCHGRLTNIECLSVQAGVRSSIWQYRSTAERVGQGGHAHIVRGRGIPSSTTVRVFVTRGIGVNILVRRAGDDRILVIRHDDIERTSHRLSTIIYNRVSDGGGADGIVVVGCLIGNVRDACLVVVRSEGRHRQLNRCIVLTIVRISCHIARA